MPLSWASCSPVWSWKDQGRGKQASHYHFNWQKWHKRETWSLVCVLAFIPLSCLCFPVLWEKSMDCKWNRQREEKPNCRSSAPAGEFISCFQQEKIARKWGTVDRFLSRTTTDPHSCRALSLSLHFAESKHFTFVLPSIFEICRCFLSLNPCTGGICTCVLSFFLPTSFYIGSTGMMPLALCLQMHFIHSECLAELHIVLMASSSHTWWQNECATFLCLAVP